MASSATPAATRETILAVWRIESARLIGALSRVVRDVGVAEELAQDAFVAALEQWPNTGVPERPGAWLMTVAKHRAIDHLRRGPMMQKKHEQLGHDAESERVTAADFDMRDAGGDDVGDDVLRLVFVACHPVLSTEARVALTLRLVGGLTVEEIARALLMAESTVAQRIVRAKRTLAKERVPFEVPGRDEWPARLSSVLEVIYLIFNEGYAASHGDDWMRPGLCEDALRLARVVAARMPDEAEAHGLAALLEIQASRAAARIGPRGEPVLLLDQDRSRWNRLFIRRGLLALERAQDKGGGSGVYALQAAIAACHARASTAAATDWPRIAALYQALVALTHSPIVELNRAVAVAMAFGPAAGLAIVDDLIADLGEGGALADYHLLPSVRGDLLEKLGRSVEAGGEFTKAAAQTRNSRERQLLLARAAACV